jgi:hypothetical protein
MLYAFLCYNDESTVMSWTKEEDDAVMDRLSKVHDKLTQQGRLGPSLRLMSTGTASTLLKEKDVVLDGPYAETKEALLGFYVIDCENLDHALEIARDLGKANPGGAYEVRPIRMFNQGLPVTS